MKHMLASGLSAAVLLLSAGQGMAATPPAAAPAAPAPVQTAAQTAELQRWMADVARWSQHFSEFGQRRVATMSWLLEGADALVAKLQAGGPDVARPWAAAWAQEARDRLAADMESYAAASGPVPKYPSSLPTNPDIQTAVRVLERSSESIGGMVIASNYASSAFIEVVERAASGEEADLMQLDGAKAGLMIAQMDAENAMISGSMEVGGPSGYLARSQYRANRALMVYFELIKRLYTEDSPDRSATVQGMRAEVANMRREVNGIRAEVAKMRSEMQQAPELRGTPLGDMLAQLTGAQERSADAEAKIADAIDALADAVAADDVEAEDRAWVAIQRHIEERSTLAHERRAIAAQSGA